nr:MAG TPA: hypothetical protein [Caudoviricetes sp.]
MGSPNFKASHTLFVFKLYNSAHHINYIASDFPFSVLPILYSTERDSKPFRKFRL